MITSFPWLNFPPLFRFHLRNKSASELWLSTKQVSCHLEDNGRACAHKVPPLKVIALWLVGLHHVILRFPQMLMTRSRFSLVTSSRAWKRRTVTGGGAGTKRAIKACSLPFMWRPYRQTHISAHTLRDTNFPHIYACFYLNPPTETLYSLFCRKDKAKVTLFWCFLRKTKYFHKYTEITQPHFLGWNSKGLFLDQNNLFALEIQ